MRSVGSAAVGLSWCCPAARCRASIAAAAAATACRSATAVGRPLLRLSASSASSSGYWTIEAAQEHEVEIKKSRFLVNVWPITSSEQAKQLLASHSDPTASHNCYAWKLGAAARSSDDGEPSGTAGKPILSAIEGDGLDGVCVLVTRYYGGTKLGAGGLVRAYGGAARDCLRAAPKAFVKPQVQLQLTCPFDLLGAVYGMLQKHGATVGAEEYTSDGRVQLPAAVDADQMEALCEAVTNATQGRVVPVQQ